MISVAEAAHAYLLDAVALAESDGSRVWWAPWGPQPSGDDEGDHVYSYFMVLDDGARGIEFALRYEGRPNDLVPEGFWDFTLFLEGGKGHLSDLLSPVPPSERAAEPERAEDGRPLRLVRWLVAQAGETIDPSATGGTHLRCYEDGALVAVDNPEQECPCGEFNRDDDGRLFPVEGPAVSAVYSTVAGDGVEWQARSSPAPAPERAGTESALRLVRWLVPRPGETLDPAGSGGTHLRCLYDETLVAVDDPDQRCPCGRLGRDAGGRLLPLTEGQICVVYSTAAGGAPEPAGARQSV
ncbi:hypothetical protein SAMN05216223_11339 [Actinacidiphila yanglinensis]|uniref:Uncharacterized protein n=1 Tax=Actinacidiphila yanglinensis TaxID=310779 RepID=A0A1H6D9F3_9ACTN|nr:hypothetical protein [Actinacidiphila yanglinensis]SEG81900.1 hypothetical protein SAMN05216223_11339 [Actinacidiphila yanglinensis]